MPEHQQLMEAIERFLVDREHDDIGSRTFSAHQKVEVVRLEVDQLEKAQVAQQQASDYAAHCDYSDSDPSLPLSSGGFPGEHGLCTRLTPNGYSVARTSCSRVCNWGDKVASISGVIKPTPSRSCM